MSALRSHLKSVPGLKPAYRFVKTGLRNLEHRFRRDSLRERVFDDIFRRNAWGSPDSLSGPGSSLAETEVVRRSLPEILRRYKVKSMLDVPCGDFAWMQHVDLSEIEYTGADIVPSIVKSNLMKYRVKGINFIKKDIVRDNTGKYDLIFVRDCLVHLCEDDIFIAVEKIKKSDSRFLFTTSFPDHKQNHDIITGSWRPLNLQAPPFLLPEPLHLIREGHPEAAFADKSLCLWRISDLG